MKISSKGKKIIGIVLCVILITGIALGGFFLYFYSVGVKPSSTKNISVGDGNNIRAGLISDTQLNPYNNSEHENYYNNLIDALKILKEQKAEIIIHAGDVGDINSKVAYKTYNKALE